jgi:tetratricopeptide (TPR) repeat protein
VILYELTTGSLPYEFSARSVAEMERLVREVEPALPSTRGNDRRLRGDIDNIITKALRKEPQQRYASAADLSSDIGRWLEGYPVQARKPSRRYRATKFVRRHRLGVAAAAVMVLILAGGIVSTRRAQLRAERRFADVRALANTFLFDFQGAIREVPGTLPAQALVVRKAQEYLDRLASEASGDQGLETDLALSYDRLADIQYSGGQLRLGNVAAALSNVKKAIALREALVAQAPSNSVYRQSLGNSYNRVGSIMRQGTDAASAIPYNEKAIQLLDTCLRERPRDRELRQNTAEAYKNAADAYRMLGTWPTAVKYSERAIELRDGLVREDANDTVDRSSLAVAYTGLGDTLRDSIGYAIPPGRTFGALECYRRSFEIQDALSVQSPGDALRRRNSALARGRLARALMAANDLTAARRYFAEAADIYSDLFQHDVANGELERSLSVAQLNLAKLDEQTGNYALASTGLEKAIHARRSLVARDADSLEAQDDLAYALAEIGAVQIKLTRLERARQNLTEALRLRESVESKRPRNVEDKARLGACFASIGDLEKAGRHWSAAEESYRKALATFVRLRDEGKLQDRDQPLLQSLPKQIAAARAHGE